MKLWETVLLLAILPIGLVVLLAVIDSDARADHRAALRSETLQVDALETQLRVTQEAVREREASALQLQEKTAQAKEDLAATKVQLAKVDKEVAALRDRWNVVMSNMPSELPVQANIDQVWIQMQREHEERMAEEEEAIRAVSQLLEKRRARQAELDRQIEAYMQVARQRVGSFPGVFPGEAEITQSYPDWGFVILDKGDGDGLVKGAQLDVHRGETLIGKLLVSEVFSHETVANVIRETLRPGQAIQVGDRVSR